MAGIDAHWRGFDRSTGELEKLERPTPSEVTIES